nr:Uncharacterised protein [Klebsiella pneumoniae]
MAWVTQLSSGIRVLWNGSMILNCSGCGAGALCSQSAPPPLAGAAVEAPPQASAACAALSVDGRCPMDWSDQP